MPSAWGSSWGNSWGACWLLPVFVPSDPIELTVYGVRQTAFSIRANGNTALTIRGAQITALDMMGKKDPTSLSIYGNMSSTFNVYAG